MGHATFWTASHDGSSWYRADLPAASLGWLGHETWVGEFIPASVEGRTDVIVGSRIATAEASAKWEKWSAGGTHRLVLDLDDDYFHIEPRNRAAAQFWNNDQMLTRLARNCQLADVVTVATEMIGESVMAATRGTANVEVIPNGLHASVLGVLRDYDPDVLNIGWVGTAGTAEDLDLAADSLVRILDYCADMRRPARLVLIGIPENHPALSDLARRQFGAGADVRLIPWVAAGEQYLRAVGELDIWVAPYRDTEFNRAKYPTKALEAGFWGIPLVASDITPYRARAGATVLTSGVMLVNEHRPWEWGKALKHLVDDAHLRRRMGEAARSAAAPYSMQQLGSTWERVLFG